MIGSTKCIKKNLWASQKRGDLKQNIYLFGAELMCLLLRLNNGRKCVWKKSSLCIRILMQIWFVFLLISFTHYYGFVNFYFLSIGKYYSNIFILKKIIDFFVFQLTVTLKSLFIVLVFKGLRRKHRVLLGVSRYILS